jgi:hypothetical protein
MLCRLCALGHKLGLLRMTARGLSFAAGSGSSLSRTPSNTIEVELTHALTLAIPSDLSSKQNEVVLCICLENPSKSQASRLLFFLFLNDIGAPDFNQTRN